MNDIDKAFEFVAREDFLPPEVRTDAGQDVPLPIGYGQTNSQPSTVRRMLKWLDAQPGDRVLDVGSGSGWTSALLGHIVGDSGRVYAIERISELVAYGRENSSKYDLSNVSFHRAGEAYGMPEKAPFDRILVSAGADELPDELLAQLAIGGKLVIPVGSAIFEVAKRESGDVQIIEHEGFVFVPLVGGR